MKNLNNFFKDLFEITKEDCGCTHIVERGGHSAFMVTGDATLSIIEDKDKRDQMYIWDTAEFIEGCAIPHYIIYLDPYSWEKGLNADKSGFATKHYDLVVRTMHKEKTSSGLYWTKEYITKKADVMFPEYDRVVAKEKAIAI